MDSGFHGPIVSSFIQACEERDIRYHIEFSTEATGADDAFVPPAYLAGGMVDGALVVGYCDQPFAHWLEHENTRPWVGVGESAPYFVKDNSHQNVYQVVQHLVALGHRRIAFLHGDVSFNSNEEGLRGFEQACDDFRIANMSPWVQFIPMMPRREGMEKTAAWAKKFLATDERPTAVICKGMGVARAVVSVAQQLQLEVPRQLSVIGCGTQAESERSYPCMAHIQPDYPKIVQQALYILEQRLAGREVANPSSLVAGNMVWDSTVAPPQD
jgi:DNA-binding LacI/PurR family transcriptional regulator